MTKFTVHTKTATDDIWSSTIYDVPGSGRKSAEEALLYLFLEKYVSDNGGTISCAYDVKFRVVEEGGSVHEFESTENLAETLADTLQRAIIADRLVLTPTGIIEKVGDDQKTLMKARPKNA